MAKKAAKKASAVKRAPRKPKVAPTTQTPTTTPTALPPERIEISKREDDLHRVLRAIHARFAHAIPTPAFSSGVHEPQDPVEAKGVPDGQYRVVGADWIMTVEKGLVTVFQKAFPGLDPKGITEIPAPQQTHAAG
jgi:hypothetical protein